MVRSTSVGTMRAAVLFGAVGLAVAVWPMGTHAQVAAQLNPVYVDDAPTASDTLARVKDHLGSGNLDEAVRVLQVLLDEHGGRMTASADDPEVFVGVRARVHAELLNSAPMLARYRALFNPRAAAELEAGGAANVETTLLLTSAGFESALRTAQRQQEAGQFEAARLTLEQLERHPDRLGGAGAGDKAASLGADAAALLRTTASFIDRAEVWARAERWAAEAGAGRIERVPHLWPKGATVRGESPLDALPELMTTGLISKPLWSIALGPNNPSSLEFPGGGLGNMGRGSGAGNIPPNARMLEILPTASEDLLVINDGTVISAWDRFTLSPRWWVQPSGIAQGKGGEDGEVDRAFGFQRRGSWNNFSGSDALTVTIRGRYGAFSTGRAAGSGRDGDDRVHGIDAKTGRVRWTRTLTDIDPGLADSSIRGPVEMTEGVVIVSARKHLPDRRLLSLTLIGLDADSGKTLWQRLVGSAGWLPFAAQAFGPEGPIVDRGVVYRTDRLGLVAAVEAVSGRTVWVRRMPAEASNAGPSDPQPWEISRPVIDNTRERPSLIVITPDQKRIVRLDTSTGAVLGESAIARFSQPAPAYLLSVGESLVAVAASTPGTNGSSRITVAPLASFETSTVQMTPSFDPPGIWGRVSVIGDKLLVPISGGLAVVDPANATQPPLVQALDEPGNVLAIGRQLLVVDDTRAHSYLQWETAESILTDRMKGDPKDPTPAVTFTELAYRAGRPERIASSVDAALAAIKVEPEGERSQLARARLFETLNTMVNSGLEPVEHQSPGAGLDRAITAPTLPVEGAAPTSTNASRGRGAVPPRIQDRNLLAALVDRLGVAATSTDDRVAFALARGRLAEQDGSAAIADATTAVALYQKVLDDPQLSSANWRGNGVSIRGELEAVRRIEQLISKFGVGIYATQEEESRRALAEAGEGAAVEQLEQIVARYPLASSTPAAYLKLHDAYRKGDRARSSTIALELGLKAAQRISNASATAVGELAGRLINELRAKKQMQAAAGVLRNVKRKFPQIQLTAEGAALDTAMIEGDLARSIAATMRWPRIGQITGEHMQLIKGSSLLTPILHDSTPHVVGCVAMESEREVSIWSADGVGGGGELKKMWSRRIDEAGASLIKTTADAAYILSRSNKIGGVEKVPVSLGANGWKSEPPIKLFPADDGSRGMNRAPGVMADQFETPDDGIVPADDLIVAMDERTLVLVQRGGRIAALDTDTGEVLWNGSTPIARVYDVQISGGVLVIAGDAGKADAAGAMMDVSPTIQIVDARTGRMGQRLADLEGRVRWVRLTDEGALVCGLESKVLSIDLTTSQRNWTIESPDVMPAAAAWIFGDRLLLMSTDRTLWLASVSSGRLNPKPLDAPRSHVESTRELDAYLTSGNPDGPFAVATQQGIMIFGPTGELDGVDGMGGLDTMILPRAAEDRAVAVETVSDGRGNEGLMQFSIHVLETGGGMLVDSRPVMLGARPMEVVLLDGKIVVTAGAVTVILEAPSQGK